MAYFYYTDLAGDRRQVEADSYRRLGAGGSTIIRYAHDTNSGPYNQSFDGEIISIRSLGGTWKPNPNQAPLPCIPNPAYEGNQIYDDFDAPYGDNNGICFYDVTISTTCKTNFYVGGSIVLTLNYCPPIDEDPRNPGCEECCRELLPAMRSLHI